MLLIPANKAKQYANFQYYAMRKIFEGISVITGFPGCSHVYILTNEKNEKLLIDAGNGETLKGTSFTPKTVILTHAHYDHSSGVKKAWENVFLHEREWEKQSEAHFFPPNAKKLSFSKLTWGEFELEIIHTPGHTMGSICIFEKKNKVLFSGDTIFHGGDVGRTDLGGNEKELEESLRKLEKISYAILCPGH